MLMVGLYVSRVLLKKLGIEDYGVYNIVGSIVVLFGMVRNMFTNAIQRFLNYSKNEEGDKQNEIFNAGLRLQLLLAGGFLVLTETIGLYAFIHLNLTEEQFTVAHVVYQMTIASAVVSILTVPYDALIIAKERMNIFAWLSIINSIMNLGVVYLISLGPFSRLVNYAILLFMVTCVIRCITIGYCCRNFKECRIRQIQDKMVMREMTGFAGWNFLGFAGLNVMHQGVDYLMNLAGGVVVNAARGVAYQVMGCANMLVSNADMAFKPQTNAAAANTDKSEFYKLLGYNAKTAFVCYLLIVVPLLIFARQAIGLWLGQVPEYVVDFLLAISPYYLLRSLHQLVNQFFVSIGEMKWYQVIEVCTMVMIIPMAWALLKGDYAFWTVFVGMTVVEAVNHAGSVWLAVRKYRFPLRYFVREVYLPFVIVTTVAFVMVYGAYEMGVPKMVSWSEIIGTGACVESAMLATIGLIVLNREERKRLVDVIRGVWT